MALSSTAQELLWLQQLLADLTKGPTKSMVIYEDNQSAMIMANDPQFHGRSKHIDIKYHFIREQVTKRSLELKYCKSASMVADIMTKGLTGERFEKLRKMTGLHPMKVRRIFEEATFRTFNVYCFYKSK